MIKLLRALNIRTYQQFRLTLRLIALPIGLICGFIANVYFETNQFWFAGLFYLGIVIATVIEFVLADLLADWSFPFDTERKLQLMERRLGQDTLASIAEKLREVISEFGACDRARISATVHVVAELSSTSDKRVRLGLLQLTDYVGPEGGKKGRLTLITQGIIGRCARTGKVEAIDFADEVEYDHSMVCDFGFTEEETKTHSRTARSYLAVPLKSEGVTVGVIYFFTSEPQVFPGAVDLAELNKAAKDIVRYLRNVSIV